MLTELESLLALFVVGEGERREKKPLGKSNDPRARGSAGRPLLPSPTRWDKVRVINALKRDIRNMGNVVNIKYQDANETVSYLQEY